MRTVRNATHGFMILPPRVWHRPARCSRA
jgi:hypothetical protein